MLVTKMLCVVFLKIILSCFFSSLLSLQTVYTDYYTVTVTGRFSRESVAISTLSFYKQLYQGGFSFFKKVTDLQAYLMLQL